MAFDGIVADRRPKVQTRTGYAILTGYPPPLQQIAAQVRSSSGMTYGMPRPGGGPAMQASGFTSNRIIDPPAPAARFVPPEPAAPAAPKAPYVPAPDRMLAKLQELDADRATLPGRPEMLELFGRQCEAKLHALQNRGRLKFWWASNLDRHTPGAVIIRLTGSAHELRTANAPAHRHV